MISLHRKRFGHATEASEDDMRPLHFSALQSAVLSSAFLLCFSLAVEES